MNNIVLIAAVEAEHAARAAGDVSIEDRARAAMRATRNHWMATQEEDQFTAACEGLARTATPDELERIEADLRTQQALAAMLNGVPVDLEAALAARGEVEPIGLMKLWHETAPA